MKKIKLVRCVITICVIFLLILWCCTQSANNKLISVSMKKYYTLEDFSLIKIGESTYWDVCSIAPTENMQITSYGGMCKYPIQNGDYIIIKFFGKDLIVGSIRQGTVCVNPNEKLRKKRAKRV